MVARLMTSHRSEYVKRLRPSSTFSPQWWPDGPVCLNSDILRLEVRRNPSTAERERIEDSLGRCAEAVAESAEVLHLAQALQQLTLRVHDALHLASAGRRKGRLFSDL